VKLDEFDALVRTRRTSMVVDAERPVPSELIEQLCTLALWAPNHKLTFPWRFAVCTGDGRSQLGEALYADQVAAGARADHPKTLKTKTKYTRTPAVLVVGSAADYSEDLHAENRDAVAAGIQNILLGATAAGLASFWGSAAVIDGAATLGLCGFESDTRLIGLIYLGYASGEVATPPRPALALNRVG
jgi:nitroreductase